jgi:serine/threonine-protein phosphatase 4 regulatory subunit 1
LSLLESPRSKYLELWAQVVKAEDLLWAHKRSFTNPSLLNWRQRDGVARSLPHLLLLMEPQHIRSILWPFLKMLLQDGVSLVRENAEWSIPILLLSYGNENFPEGEEVTSI